MGQEKLLTVRDVSIMLGVSEKEILDLAETGAIPAYKVGGVYLRFRRDQIEEFIKNSRFTQINLAKNRRQSLSESFSDFLYFNDFYIYSTIIILVIVFIIFKEY